MARPKGSKNKKSKKKEVVKEVEAVEIAETVKIEVPEPPEVVEKVEVVEDPPEVVEPEKPAIKGNSGLEDRPYFSVDEAARYLGVAEACARLWFDHGHLTGKDDRGPIRISRASILRVKDSNLLK